MTTTVVERTAVVDPVVPAEPRRMAYPASIQAAQAAMQTRADQENLANADPIRPGMTAVDSKGGVWRTDDTGRHEIKQSDQKSKPATAQAPVTQPVVESETKVAHKTTVVEPAHKAAVRHVDEPRRKHAA